MVTFNIACLLGTTCFPVVFSLRGYCGIHLSGVPTAPQSIVLNLRLSPQVLCLGVTHLLLCFHAFFYQNQASVILHFSSLLICMNDKWVFVKIRVCAGVRPTSFRITEYRKDCLPKFLTDVDRIDFLLLCVCLLNLSVLLMIDIEGN